MNKQIQIIQDKNSKENFKHENITISNLENPISLDNFDINIINLSSESIWITKNPEMNTNIHMRDFKNINRMIFDSYTSNIIIILPQNIQFSTDTKQIKPMKLQYVTDKIQENIKIIFPSLPTLGYEKNFKKINEKKFSADFYFKLCGATLISSDKSKKALAIIQNERIISTTLKIETTEYLFDFLNEIDLIDTEIEIPEWFSDINMFDDLSQKKLIEKNKHEIKKLQIKNENAQNKLDENNEYKSILYKQSKPLEESVRKIIGELLEYDLSNFKDTGGEDFLIEFDDVTFIGEIKGVKKNITNEHLNKLDLHLTRRQKKVKDENLQPLFIANRFINRPPEKREPVNHDQIENATNKYKILIIDTYDLLKLFEKFKNGEMTSEKIKNKFNEEIGLFEL